MKNLAWGAALLVMIAAVLLTDATPVRKAESRHGPATSAQAVARGTGATQPGTSRGQRRSDPIAARVPILVVGDSLEVGTGPHLERALGEQVRVFARRGRPSAEGLRVLRRRLRESHGVVVFDLGSNDDRVGPAGLARSMRAARRLITPRRCMVVATLNPDRREPLNEVIRRIATRRHVVLFDWQRLTKRRPDLLSEDGIHAVPQGYAVRARKLIRTIHTCPVPRPASA
jgi:hypothetical protein